MGPVEQVGRPPAGGLLLGVGVAGAGLLGGGRLHRHRGAAQLGDPVGLLGGGQDRQPVGHGGARVRQAAVPHGDLGQARVHGGCALRLQRRRGVVEDPPEVGLRAGEVAAPQPQRPRARSGPYQCAGD